MHWVGKGVRGAEDTVSPLGRGLCCKTIWHLCDRELVKHLNHSIWHGKLTLMVVCRLDSGGEGTGGCQSAGCCVAQVSDNGLLTWGCTATENYLELRHSRHSSRFGVYVPWQTWWFSPISISPASTSCCPVLRLCRASWYFCVPLAEVFGEALMAPRLSCCLLQTRHLKKLFRYSGIF